MACYKTDVTHPEKIPSLVEQRALVRNLGNVRTSGVPKSMDDEEENLDFKGMVTSKEVVTSDICVKLLVVQRFCENGIDAVTTTNVEVIKLARVSVEMKRKNATLSDQNTDTKGKFVKTCAAESTMRSQL